MNKRRLNTLKNFLMNKVNPDRFVMEEWAGEIKNGKPACGTSACALGWATAIPSFNKNGLRMAKLRKYDKRNIYVTIKGMRNNYVEETIRPNVSLHRSLKAAMKFFDITHTEASHIFTEDVFTLGQEGLDFAVERIDEVLAGHFR